MAISLITNFQVNSNNPIDTRLVATGPDALNNMEYKYAGLTVYRTDSELHYVWDGATWEVASDGIFGGSGSLIGDTTIDTGFLGTVSNYDAYKLIISASGSTETFNQVSNFSTNTNIDAQFKYSLLFGTYSGPYITFNPDYNTGFNRGALSFGTGYINTYERFRIEPNGVIKFRPSTSVTASLSISETLGDLSLGYNWIGSKEIGGIGSSFFRFTDQVITLQHAPTNSSIFTHSVVFYNSDNVNVADFNGEIRTKGISLGYGIGYHSISNQGVGIGFSKDGEEISIFNNSNTKSISLIDKKLTLGATDYHIIFTQSTTFSVYGTFESKYITNIWDNAFNVDRAGLTEASSTDNYWVRMTNVVDSFNDLSDSSGILVFLNTGSYSQDAEFKFKTNGYTAKNSISSWMTSKKPYDRIFYFYNDFTDITSYHITHELSWYLSPDNGINWKKIGIVETGNIDDYNQDSGATGSYAVRSYANSAIVPANMDFKIKFRFRNSYTPTTTMATASCPSVKFTVIRSGNWRTGNSDESISNV